jgi:hypothetical protein
VSPFCLALKLTARGVVQVVECLSNKRKALSSSPSTDKERQREREREIMHISQNPFAGSFFKLHI